MLIVTLKSNSTSAQLHEEKLSFNFSQLNQTICNDTFVYISQTTTTYDLIQPFHIYVDGKLNGRYRAMVDCSKKIWCLSWEMLSLCLLLTMLIPNFFWAVNDHLVYKFQLHKIFWTFLCLSLNNFNGISKDSFFGINMIKLRCESSRLPWWKWLWKWLLRPVHGRRTLSRRSSIRFFCC